MDEVFLLLDYFTVFRGSNGIQVVFRSSLHFGTPENRHHNAFFHFFKTICRHIIQERNPQSFVVKLVQMVLEFSCSRRGRPQNAILVLKSSNLRFHRGTAKFIALIGKTSRCFNELDPENLHRCSILHDCGRKRSAWARHLLRVPSRKISTSTYNTPKSLREHLVWDVTCIFSDR